MSVRKENSKVKAKIQQMRKKENEKGEERE